MKHPTMSFDRHDRRGRGGFVFIDFAMGLALLGLITFALAGSIGRQQRVAQKLSDTRTATRLAEDALASMQAGRPWPGGEGMKVTRIPDPAPAGCVWARASVQVGMGGAD